MLCASVQANAALTLFNSYVGHYGLSTDGGGSTSSAYDVNAFVPVGSVVTAAFLYQSNSGGSSANPVSLNGTALTFSGYTNNFGLNSARADVTSIVAGVVNGGAGGTYNFNVTEGFSSGTDGTGLVVVYSNSLFAISTVGILDGFSASGGDTTSINFATPLSPGASGFVADLRLGIGYSCCNQASTVIINGTTITNVAGGNDDSGILANGALITLGGDNDAFSTLLPAYDDDHERYNLVPYIANGSTTITIDTRNPSGDDNIFLAAFQVSGAAAINAPVSGVPEPSTWAMLVAGFGLVGFASRRRKAAVAA
jgi:hypothetical protein